MVASHKDEFVDAFVMDTAQALHVARNDITIDSCDNNKCNDNEINGVKEV